ncbi:putative lipid II flippase FtsW [Thiomicrorhabdus sp. ZW0627]|uniref:putative lipid II flippase FtsW n=1 Tax=Thiomicrorhabdus sp. ZW0627 TaxID=3039774 RepID=UPI00243685AE|nr:putative lipid II flippase FtsW [Thiomicrorhabdus sp. ZW0627]MDG6774022.1 putative lipid II flippase FtsW [Thiomicrorhabdus sp. ZW0627]
MLQSWREKSREWPVDFWLLGLLITLAVIGLTMVASSSVAISEKRFGDTTHYFIRQFLSMGLGLTAAYILFQVPLSFWEKHRGKLFLFALFLLVMVLLLGREINGSKRWLPLLIMNFQPSEFMKLVIVVFMAGYLNRHASAVKESFEAVIRLALPFGIMAILLLMEPDYGSTFVIAVMITGMLLIAGAPWRYFVLTVLPMASLLAVLVIISPYRMARVSSFLDPWQDPYGTGYQLTQALIALGRGEWTGVGLGGSVQKLLFLPDAHTDFLFSIYAEEFGLIGVFFLILLYLFILYRLFRIGRKALEKDMFFGGMIAYGIGIWIILQAMINMGVNLGAFPTKGLTLPFMSYGGSSVLLLISAMALVFRVDFETRRIPPGEKAVQPVAEKEAE